MQLATNKYRLFSNNSTLHHYNCQIFHLKIWGDDIHCMRLLYVSAKLIMLGANVNVYLSNRLTSWENKWLPSADHQQDCRFVFYILQCVGLQCIHDMRLC